MFKSVSKWFRKFHRWIAVPTALAIPTALVIRLIGDPSLTAVWEKLERVPSILMLVMAITGGYLFLLPYIMKGKRRQNQVRK